MSDTRPAEVALTRLARAAERASRPILHRRFLEADREWRLWLRTYNALPWWALWRRHAVGLVLDRMEERRRIFLEARY